MYRKGNVNCLEGGIKTHFNFLIIINLTLLIILFLLPHHQILSGHKTMLYLSGLIFVEIFQDYSRLNFKRKEISPHKNTNDCHRHLVLTQNKVVSTDPISPFSWANNPAFGLLFVFWDQLVPDIPVRWHIFYQQLKKFKKNICFIIF